VSSQYEIVRLRSDLLERAAGLRQLAWGGTLEANIAYLQWKYGENPCLDAPLLFLALAGDEAVGMRGFYGTPWLDLESGARHVLPASSDLVIHPEHRDRGLFTTLNAVSLSTVAREGHAHVVNLSANGSNAVASMIGLGWRRVVRFRPVSVVRRRGRLDDLLAKTPKSSVLVRSRGDVFRGLDRLRGSDAGPDAIVVARTPPIDLMTTAPHPPSHATLTPAREAQFLRWRYRNPLSDYRFLSSGENPTSGYVALASAIGSSKAFVLDWAGAPEITSRLLTFAVARLDARDIQAWSGSLPDDSVAILEGAGFAAPLQSADRWLATRGLLARPTRDTDDSSWMLDRLDLRDEASWIPVAIASDEL
jgi:hypothetical protein